MTVNAKFDTLSDAAKINALHGGWAAETIPINKHSLYRKIDSIMRRIPPGTVIELGCGSGRYLEVLRKRGWQVTGVDLDAYGREYIHAADLSQPLPFDETAKFDVVISAETIEHIVDTDSFLSTIGRLLKPEGLLILTTPNLLFIVNRLRMLVGLRPMFAYADYHVRMFVWSDLKTKLERHFSVEQVRGSHVLMGVQRTRFAEIFAVLGDYFPTLAAHLIITARKRR